MPWVPERGQTELCPSLYNLASLLSHVPVGHPQVLRGAGPFVCTFPVEERGPPGREPSPHALQTHNTQTPQTLLSSAASWNLLSGRSQDGRTLRGSVLAAHILFMCFLLFLTHAWALWFPFLTSACELGREGRLPEGQKG